MVPTCSLKGGAVTSLTACRHLRFPNITTRVLNRHIAALEWELEVWDEQTGPVEWAGGKKGRGRD